jgi:hypothetical protein
MASFGELWNCRLEAAGAFVVALTARPSWFCCHQRFAVLLRFGRRRTGLAAWPRWAGRLLGRALVGVEARPVAFVLASCRSGPGRPFGVGG